MLDWASAGFRDCPDAFNGAQVTLEVDTRKQPIDNDRANG
jgi:hypothetical protein